MKQSFIKLHLLLATGVALGESGLCIGKLFTCIAVEAVVSHNQCAISVDKSDEFRSIFLQKHNTKKLVLIVTVPISFLCATELTTAGFNSVMTTYIVCN